jgi:hypothetical protein
MSRVMQCELPISNDVAYKGRVRIWDTQGCVPQCSPNGHYYSVRAESEELATVYTTTRVWALHATKEVLIRLALPYSRKNHLLAMGALASLSHLTDIGETDPHTYDQVMRLTTELTIRISAWIHSHILKLEGERDLVLATLERAIDELPQG